MPTIIKIVKNVIGDGTISRLKNAIETNGQKHFELRLSMFEIGDAEGIPYLDSEGKAARHKPSWFSRIEDESYQIIVDTIRAEERIIKAVKKLIDELPEDRIVFWVESPGK